MIVTGTTVASDASWIDEWLAYREGVVARALHGVDLIAEDLAAKVRRHDAWWASRCAELGLSDHLRRLARSRAAEVAAPTVGVREDRLRRHAAAVRRAR